MFWNYLSYLGIYLLLLELFEAYSKCFLVVGRFFLVAVQEVSQEYFGHLDGSLVDGGPDAALQYHLEHDWVRRGLHYGRLQLVTLFLDVLDRSLNRGQHNFSFFLDLNKTEQIFILDPGSLCWNGISKKLMF